MVNGPDTVYVERHGRLEATDVSFADADAVMTMIERVVGPLGLRIDRSNPTVDARLADGSRFHAVIPPLTLCGPVCNIRRFVLRTTDPAQLAASGFATAATLDELMDCVRRRRTTLVTGGTSSGKTTFLNVLSAAIPPGERIITIEDAAELELEQPHVVALEARPANSEGRGAVTVRDLVRTALRMRPDRIIVGEVRGGEAVDMLAAMNTGHEGSLGTLHANSPHDAISRLETMVLTSEPNWPLEALRRQMAAALDLIVHLERLPHGGRVIGSVCRVRSVADRLELEEVESAGVPGGVGT
ncbi:MAG: CpaF family protein [Acidimicrobiia bacterium]|nr:CpaF family protein [Acidimicrobiia bacterium]